MIPFKDDIPRRGAPVITIVLLVACVVAWLVFDDGRPGVLYLALSMLALWIFGPAVEDAAGPVRFALFCLLAGGVSLLAQVTIEPESAAPAVLTASGALAGVIAGHLLLYPRARVVVLVLVPFVATVTQVRSFVVAGLWVLLQVAFGLSAAAEPLGGLDVVFLAQLAGFALGLATIRLLTSGWRWPAPSY